MRGVVIALFILCSVVVPFQIAHALPEGALRFSLHAGLNNAYLVDSSRLTIITDAVPIAISEINTYGTTSSANFFGLGPFVELQYGLHERIALGFRGGMEYSFSGASSRSSLRRSTFRFPLLFTVSFKLFDWLEVQPAVGMNVSYNAQTLLAAPNIDVALRLRIFDRFDISSGFLYGGIGGVYFAFSVRLFDFFILPINSEITSTITGGE